MVTFKVLLLLGITWVLQSTEALKCHTCSGGHCLDDPESSFLITYDDTTPSGEDNYCYSYFRTFNEAIDVARGVEASNQNLTEVVKEGPYVGARNPEKNYIVVSYCKTDGCNTHLYSTPPKVDSTIKCYVCEESDGDCAVNVASKYLIDADPIPYRTTSKSGALNTTKALRSVADDIAPFEWETYCQTMISSNGGVFARGVSWFKKGEWEDGKCRVDSSVGYEVCYCKSRDGCNDQNGSEGLRASFFAVTVFFILSNQVFLWGK